LRTAFVDGLVLSRPDYASRVHVEHPAAWGRRKCWKSSSHGTVGSGRVIQHDVYLTGNGDAGLFCELKWLKQQKAAKLAQDIWKLALSRGVAGERTGPRTFLLVGGQRTQFTATTNKLRNGRMSLRWSRRGGTRGPLPSPTKLTLSRALSKSLAFDALISLLSWGSSPQHTRRPPECRDKFKISCRRSWELAAAGRSWCLALLELHAEGCGDTAISWPGVRANVPFAC